MVHAAAFSDLQILFPGGYDPSQLTGGAGCQENNCECLLCAASVSHRGLADDTGQHMMC
jgi:hypothetical protein